MHADISLMCRLQLVKHPDLLSKTGCVCVSVQAHVCLCVEEPCKSVHIGYTEREKTFTQDEYECVSM